MKLVGLVMVRNGAEKLPRHLDHMAAFCDAIVVVDDRSRDCSIEICRRHPSVSSVLRIDPDGRPDVDWLVSEGFILRQLYTMAHLESADWAIRLDIDEEINHPSVFREVLEDAPRGVSGVCFPKSSTWDDPDFPLLVPLMGSGLTMQGAAWRPYADLDATQPLHNLRLPEGVSAHGPVVTCDRVTFLHDGWQTLAVRVERARLYSALDPTNHWNHGVAYDRGLLFGYSFAELDTLLTEYRARYAAATSLGRR
jgi:hypothetical protein